MILCEVNTVFLYTLLRNTTLMSMFLDRLSQRGLYDHTRGIQYIPYISTTKTPIIYCITLSATTQFWCRRPRPRTARMREYNTECSSPSLSIKFFPIPWITLLEQGFQKLPSRLPFMCCNYIQRTVLYNDVILLYYVWVICK